MVLLGPAWLPSDAVHGVLREEAWDAGREAQTFERSATEGKAKSRLGSWFSMTSSLSGLLSQLIWNRVTRD